MKLSGSSLAVRNLRCRPPRHVIGKLLLGDNHGRELVREASHRRGTAAVPNEGLPQRRRYRRPRAGPGSGGGMCLPSDIIARGIQQAAVEPDCLRPIFPSHGEFGDFPLQLLTFGMRTSSIGVERTSPPRRTCSKWRSARAILAHGAARSLIPRQCQQRFPLCVTASAQFSSAMARSAASRTRPNSPASTMDVTNPSLLQVGLGRSVASA